MFRINKTLIRNMFDDELVNACDFGKCEDELTDMEYLVIELVKRLDVLNQTDNNNQLTDNTNILKSKDERISFLENELYQIQTILNKF